jgi:PleD family two-component response regulator
MRRKPIHILLLEKNPADVRFIREALVELEEIQLGNSWLSPYEITDVESLAEASLLLAETNFDVLLVDLNLDPSNCLETIRRLRASASHIPIVALTPREDPALAIRLFQEGVEDVLVKNEMDCSPLGRSLRGAIERQRITVRLRSLAIRDDLSGLLNFTGFVQMGELLARLVARAATPAKVVLFSLDNFGTLSARVGQQEEEWLLLECAELLRKSSQDGDLLAYLGHGRFAWLCLDRENEAIQRELAFQESELALKFLRRGHAISLRYRIGLSALDASSNWSLVTALETAEEQSWPIHLPALASAPFPSAVH